ncbi:MAG TPA: YIP1 family protein, partial [Dehalococcoidia bacterium]|nr:YIP1 family protein [Dehalococcoidia bacterium]
KPQSLFNKMLRAAQLDINLYEEVEADKRANLQAFTVVILVSLASGLGTAIAGILSREDDPIWFLWGLLIGIGVSILGWLMWALVTYAIGVTIFKGPETEADYGQLLRTIGFSTTPGALRFFSFIPFIGGVIAFVASVWALIAGVIAVRQALDFSTWRAIGTCIVGWLLYILVLFLVPSFIIGREILF